MQHQVTDLHTLAAAIPREESRAMRLLKVFVSEHPLGAIGAVIVLFLILVAMFAPWIAPYGPKVTDFAAFLPMPHRAPMVTPTPTEVRPTYSESWEPHTTRHAPSARADST